MFFSCKNISKISACVRFRELRHLLCWVLSGFEVPVSFVFFGARDARSIPVNGFQELLIHHVPRNFLDWSLAGGEESWSFTAIDIMRSEHYGFFISLSCFASENIDPSTYEGYSWANHCLKALPPEVWAVKTAVQLLGRGLTLNIFDRVLHYVHVQFLRDKPGWVEPRRWPGLVQRSIHVNQIFVHCIVKDSFIDVNLFKRLLQEAGRSLSLVVQEGLFPVRSSHSIQIASLDLNALCLVELRKFRITRV